MPAFLVKFLSYAIFIAEQQQRTVLILLLKDYAKTKVTKIQFIFILMLVESYRKNTLLINNEFYKVLFIYIDTHANNICKTLILL